MAIVALHRLDLKKIQSESADPAGAQPDLSAFLYFYAFQQFVICHNLIKVNSCVLLGLKAARYENFGSGEDILGFREQVLALIA